MARLTELSTELILDILRGIPPEDLEPTSESCRLLRHVAQPLLLKHRRKLEQEYERCKPPVNKAWSTDQEAWSDDLKGWYTGLLCTVITDKRIGRLVKNLQVISRAWDLVGKKGGWDSNQPFPGALPGFTIARRHTKDRDPGTFLQISEQALHQSKLIPEDEKEDWLKGLQKGTQMLAVVLLLENLPALVSIEITIQDGENETEYDWLLKWVEQAAADCRSHSPPNTPLSLPCRILKTVHLEFDRFRKYSVTHVKAFLALPTISHLTCKGLHMEKNKHRPGTGLISYPSTISDLTFLDTSLDLTALSELLQHSSNLNHFSYSYEWYPYLQEEDESLVRGPLNMIPALGRSVGHCLDILYVYESGRAIRLAPETFKAFRSLTSLRINPFVLQDEENGSNFRGVAGALPAGLEELIFYWSGKSPFSDVQDVREYLTLLMQEANDVLPRLHSIVICGPISKADEDTVRVEVKVPSWQLFKAAPDNHAGDRSFVQVFFWRDLTRKAPVTKMAD